jgi:hypothetical protein
LWVIERLIGTLTHAPVRALHQLRQAAPEPVRTHSNPIAPPHPPPQRLPPHGPIKTAPKEISRRSSRHCWGSPDRVLSFIGTNSEVRSGLPVTGRNAPAAMGRRGFRLTCDTDPHRMTRKRHSRDWAKDRALPCPREDWCGRHGRGLSRAGHTPVPGLLASKCVERYSVPSVVLVPSTIPGQ